MKDFIKKIPGIRFMVRMGYYVFIELFNLFPGSEKYWKNRYDLGGTSGDGSYDELVQFKADIINRFVEKEDIETIIEYSCGVGNQLKLADYSSYIGFDISTEALSRCEEIFSNDPTKTFKLMKEYEDETAQLTLSLDVIYHLIEDDIYHSYMKLLFNSSTQYVIIYSPNTDKQEVLQMKHVKHRKFSDWIAENKPKWDQIKKIEADDGNNTFADFFIYKKKGSDYLFLSFF